MRRTRRCSYQCEGFDHRPGICLSAHSKAASGLPAQFFAINRRSACAPSSYVPFTEASMEVDIGGIRRHGRALARRRLDRNPGAPNGASGRAWPIGGIDRGSASFASGMGGACDDAQHGMSTCGRSMNPICAGCPIFFFYEFNPCAHYAAGSLSVNFTFVRAEDPS